MEKKVEQPLTEEQRARGMITEDERRALGKGGKLWCIEVEGEAGKEIKRYRLDNRTEGEVFRFRRDVFATGLMVPAHLDDPGQWVVIPPWSLRPIFITRQSKFFEP